MHGFHASNATCNYGWVLHVVSIALAAAIGLIAVVLAWWS